MSLSNFVKSILPVSGLAPQTGVQSLLVLFTGESNSGGQARNQRLTVNQRLPRPALKILDNIGLQFVPIQIGWNTNLGHTGLEPYFTHGWENGLATRIEAGTFNLMPTYLVKAGQGGSRIDQWDENADYYTRLKQRMTAATQRIQAVTGLPPKIVIWYSQGINDFVAGTNINTWKTATIAHLNKMISRYDPEVICSTFFTSSYQPYNDAWLEVAAAVPLVQMINTTGLPMDDGAHWNYAGMAEIASRMCDVTLNYIQ